MSYLCATHRQSLLQKSELERWQFWRDFMNKSGHHYGSSSWHHATVFAGNAMDISSLCIEEKADTATVSELNRYCLAVVYLFNTLLQQDRHDSAHQLIQFACQRVSHFIKRSSNIAAISEDYYLEVLFNEAEHALFIQQHTQLPFFENVWQQQTCQTH
jgi:hypothetical protein